MAGDVYPCLGLVQDIYEEIESKSGVRSVMVDFFAHELYANSRKENLKDHPQELLVDLCLQLN